MKKILLFILAFCALGVFASCGKKKVLTKRTMENIKEDFTFESSEPIFDAYSMDGKSPRNEFRLHSSRSNYRNITLTAKNKTVIESVSFKLYNASETETIYTYDYSNCSFVKDKAELKSGRKVTRYYFPGKYLADPKNVEIAPKGEIDVVVQFEKCELNSNNMFHVILFLAGISTDRNDYVMVMNNGGVYNFKIQYSIYM